MAVPLSIDDVDWTAQLCTLRGCVSLAECLYEGEPYCLACAENLLERQIALGIAPRLRSTLPPLVE